MLILSCLNYHMISLSWLKPDWYNSEQPLVKVFFFFFWKKRKSFFYLHHSCIPKKFRNYIRMQNINFLFVCKKELGADSEDCKQLFTCVQACHLQLYRPCTTQSCGTVPHPTDLSQWCFQKPHSPQAAQWYASAL